MSILKEVLTAILPKKLYIIIVLKESLHITMQNSWLILLILFLYIKINHQNVFTKEIINSIDHCSSDDELLFFFKENKSIFTQYNVTALDCINTLYNKNQG